MLTRRDDPGTGDERPGPAGRRRPDTSMSLLADLFAGGLSDPGYAEAARRRAAGAPGSPAPPRGRSGSAGVLLVLVLTGTLLAVAGAEVRRGEPVAAERRHRLVAEIRARTAESDRLEHRVDALRAETERRRAEALARSDTGRRVRHRLARAAAAAAAVPAAGAGLVITLDDAPRAAPAARPGDDAGRVYDQDLQVLVNGLWAAGATAIGVNGRRLAPTTAIRAAGEAIIVDHRPLARPYAVTALGDPGRLRAGFTGSAADRRLTALAERFGVRYDVRRADRARLPAAGPFRLRHAAPRREDGQ